MLAGTNKMEAILTRRDKKESKPMTMKTIAILFIILFLLKNSLNYLMNKSINTYMLCCLLP